MEWQNGSSSKQRKKLGCFSGGELEVLKCAASYASTRLGIKK